MSATATMTLPTQTATTSIPLTGHDETASAMITLRSLYARAARAFLQRDVSLTLTLITSALLLIPSPPTLDDPLSTWRRKWDILRITLETTVYSTPPADPESLPSHLRSNLMLSPQSLLAALHTRSLLLFTPRLPDSQIQGTLNSAFLPPQVLITLVLASMKLGVPDVGRGIIEDWLARRERDQDVASEEGEGYDKVIELYCLHILPRLEEWDYATEFLQYEGQLESVRRHRLMYSLETLHADTMSARQRPRTPSTPSLSPTSSQFSRPASPSSSSVSSSSEQTATPRTPRFDSAEDPKGKRASLPMSMSSISVPSSAVNSANTSRTATPKPPASISTVRPRYKHTKRYSTSRAPILENPSSSSSSSVHPPSTMTVIKSTILLVKSYFKSQKMNFATMLVVAFALLSLVQLRRARRPLVTSGTTTGSSTPKLLGRKLTNGKEEVKLLGVTTRSAAEEVRKKLSAGSGSTNVLGLIWNEAVRVVGDTVRMGGRGLV